MLNFLIFFSLIIVIYFVWYKFAYDENADVIFFITALQILSSSAMFIQNDWLIRLRHLNFIMLVAWSVFYVFSPKIKIKPLVKYFILIFVYLLIASLWGELPYMALKLKTKPILFVIMFLLVGSYIDSYKKFKNLLYSLILPFSLIIIFMLSSGHNVNISSRIEIAGINSNSVGMYAAVSCLMLSIFLATFPKISTLPKILLYTFAFAAFYFSFRSGCRGAVLSLIAGLGVISLSYFKSLKKISVWIIGILIFLFLFEYFIWDDMALEAKNRMFDIANYSGRMEHWAYKLELLESAPWFGLGIVYYISPWNEYCWGGESIYFSYYFETGYIGMVIGSIGLCVLFFYIIKIFWSNKKIGFCVLAVIVFCLLSGISEVHAVRGTNPISIILMIFIGILANLNNYERFMEKENANMNKISTG